MAAKNPCSKTVKPEQAYEVWQVEEHPDYGGTWIWYVLKKYQTPDREAQNEYARWLCYVTSPYSPHGDYGDTYITAITEAGAVKLDSNPLVQTSGGEHEASQTRVWLGDHHCR